MRAIRHAVWATCAMAMAVAGCGASPARSGDAGPDGDATAPDHPGMDGGSDRPALGPDGSTPCFVPTDCSPGLTCCLVSEAGGASLTVSCQESALCVGDGVSTWIVCATDADCPPAVPACTFLTTVTGGRPFNICGPGLP